MNYNETNSTGLNKSYGLFLRRIEGRFNLSSKLLSNTNLNTDSNLLITKYNLKSLVNYICLSSILILSTSAGISYAALNATTANTIQGTKPVFDSSNTARKALGFKLGGTVYSERNGNLNNGTSTNYFASNKTLNDFIVPSLGDLFSGSTDYADTDGDVVDTTSPFTGTITFNWKDNTNATITPSSTTTLASGADACTRTKNYNFPLILTITANVQTNSKYGDPKTSVAKSLTQSYKIDVLNEYKFCYAKPNQMIVAPNNSWYDGTSWNNTSHTTANPTAGGGYSVDFVPYKGFKADAVTKFPTTGFVGAEFDLVMSTAQSDYTFTSSQPTAVSVSNASGTKGKVKFLAKPSGPVTITATVAGHSPITYVFNPTTWVVPKGSVKSNYGGIASICGVTNLPTRADLTNSPKKNAPTYWIWTDNYYTRAIGGGVFGEWGHSEGGVGNTYPDSLWLHDLYWTKDVHIPGNSQYIVNSRFGSIQISAVNSETTRPVVCKG